MKIIDIIKPTDNEEYIINSNIINQDNEEYLKNLENQLNAFVAKPSFQSNMNKDNEFSYNNIYKKALQYKEDKRLRNLDNFVKIETDTFKFVPLKSRMLQNKEKETSVKAKITIKQKALNDILSFLIIQNDVALVLPNPKKEIKVLRENRSINYIY